MVLYLLQGGFTSWNDGTQLTHSYWFEPNLYRIKSVNRTTQILSTNTVMTRDPGQKGWTDKQPDQSLNKKCTVAVIDYDLQYYMKWFVVSCNETFDASYICQRRLQPHTTLSLQNPYFACEKKWFAVSNHSKCYMMITSSPTLTFDAAVQSCLLMNSSLLSLASDGSLAYNENYVIVGRWMGRIRNNWMFHKSAIKVGFDALKRKTLNHTQPLLFFIERCSKYLLTTIRILARVDGRCARAEYSNRTISGFRRWTAEYCSEYDPTDVFICEKPSVEHTTIMCNAEYYQCEDGTCILSLYVCDTVNDCLGGEDESRCDPTALQQASFYLQNSSLYLPCSIYHNCNDTLESLVPPVELHTICDGLMSRDIILDEDDMCIKRHVENINLNQLIVNSRWTWTNNRFVFEDQLPYLVKLAAMEKVEVESMRKLAKNSFDQSPIHNSFEIPCQKSEYFRNFSDMCRIAAYVEQCALRGRQDICPYMVCPGMFRCKSSYCIYMSLVCDGQRDCIYGEDEASCTDLSCPGFLKCRGESRCVSPDQICDEHVDCILSFDDEIRCGFCPTFCTCDGYLLYCTLDNMTDIITITGKTYSKGVILRGNLTVFNIFTTLSLIFIDVSSCNISQVNFILHNDKFYQKLFFSNFSDNLIDDITFFRAEPLSKLVVVDVSNNFITSLTSNNLRLSYLVVIYAKNNPIFIIHIGDGMDSLKFVDLQHVEFQWWLAFTTNKLKLKTAVSQSILCCLWPSSIECIFDGEYTKCHGIMNNMASLIVCILLTILAATFVLAVTFKTVKTLIQKRKIKKFYNICILNHMVASIFTITCLVCLFTIEILHIHLISWKQSFGCHIINGLFSISLGTSLVFKTVSVAIINMKIILPFAHQCQWLKKTFVASMLLWLIICLLYCVSTIQVIIRFKIFIFDNFCSVGECHTPIHRRLMYAFICSVDSIFLMIICILFVKTTEILREKNQNEVIVRKLKVWKIVLHLTRKIIPQTAFFFCLCLIPLFQFIDTFWNEHYCYSVFTHVLPIVIIMDCVFSIY